MDPTLNGHKPRSGTYRTKIGKWLALIRLQSTPVTVISLLLGYFTVNQTLYIGIWPLVIVGALGHWGFYAHNDVEDISVDMAQGKSMKPLLSGDIKKTHAEMLSYSFIILSILGAVLWFNPFAASAYLLAAVSGWYYNIYSSEKTYSGLLLSLWGVSIIWTGAAFAQGWSGFTIVLSLLFGVHMMWMTVIGDLKDIENDENNLPHKFDCHVTEWYWPHTELKGDPRLFKSLRFQIFVTFPLVMSQIILSYLLVLGGVFFNGANIITTVATALTVLLSYFYFVSSATIGNNEPYSEEKTTQDVVVNEVVGVLMITTACTSFLPLELFGAVVMASVIFGLSVLRIQFGSFTTFP